MTGHIIATDPRGRTILPKSAMPMSDTDFLQSGEAAVYRVIRGTAEFKDGDGKTIELAAGDVATAGRHAIAWSASARTRRSCGSP